MDGWTDVEIDSWTDGRNKSTRCFCFESSLTNARAHEGKAYLHVLS